MISCSLIISRKILHQPIGGGMPQERHLRHAVGPCMVKDDVLLTRLFSPKAAYQMYAEHSPGDHCPS